MKWLGVGLHALSYTREVQKRRRTVASEVLIGQVNGRPLEFRWSTSQEKEHEFEWWLEYLGSVLHVDLTTDFVDYFTISTGASETGVGAVSDTSFGAV